MLYYVRYCILRSVHNIKYKPTFCMLLVSLMKNLFLVRVQYICLPLASIYTQTHTHTLDVLTHVQNTTRNLYYYNITCTNWHNIVNDNNIYVNTSDLYFAYYYSLSPDMIHVRGNAFVVTCLCRGLTRISVRHGVQL